MTGLAYASGWDGTRFPRWPIRPCGPCGICGQPARPYLAGPRCDTHAPGPQPVQATSPGGMPPARRDRPLDVAWQQHPGARRCAAVDRAGRPVCPYPLDPANGDEPWHMACEPGFDRVLADIRAHDTRRQTAAARAAVAAATGGAAA